MTLSVACLYLVLLISLVAANFFLRKFWFLIDLGLVATTVGLTVNSGLGAGGTLMFCEAIWGLAFLISALLELFLSSKKQQLGEKLTSAFLFYGGRYLLVLLASGGGVYLVATINR